MSALSTIIGPSAKTEGARACSQTRKALQTNSIVMRAAHKFWPSKTSLELQDKTGASERMIQYWIANRYALSAGDLADLLRTDAGLLILNSIMGDVRPTWWKRFKQGVERSILRAEMKALAKRAEQIEMDL